MTGGARAGVVAAVVLALAAGVGIGFVLDDGGGSGRAASDGPSDVAAGGSTSTSSASSSADGSSAGSSSSSSSTTSTTAPERLDERSTLDVRGVGPIEAGMTLKTAERVGGRTFTVTEFETFGGGCYYAEPDGLPGLVLTIVSAGDQPPRDPKDGEVASVTAIENSPFRTVSGAKVGSTADEIRRLYPKGLRQDPHEYQEGGIYLTFEPQTVRDRAFGVRFEVGADGIVQSITSGDAQSIRAPEGCA